MILFKDIDAIFDDINLIYDLVEYFGLTIYIYGNSLMKYNVHKKCCENILQYDVDMKILCMYLQHNIIYYVEQINSSNYNICRFNNITAVCTKKLYDTLQMPNHIYVYNRCVVLSFQYGEIILIGRICWDTKIQEKKTHISAEFDRHNQYIGSIANYIYFNTCFDVFCYDLLTHKKTHVINTGIKYLKCYKIRDQIHAYYVDNDTLILSKINKNIVISTTIIRNNIKLTSTIFFHHNDKYSVSVRKGELVIYSKNNKFDKLLYINSKYILKYSYMYGNILYMIYNAFSKYGLLEINIDTCEQIDTNLLTLLDYDQYLFPHYRLHIDL